MRTAELQSRLRMLGFDPGPSDGVYGELTEEAIFDCLDTYTPPVELTVSGGIVPLEWMPACEMTRVIVHWTAGAYTASETDRSHYHILIEGNGDLVRGFYSIADNVSTADGVYAAHCKNMNSNSIGVSMCCMAGAVESPFDPGAYPMTETQWETLSSVVADLCAAYTIPVTRETVLSHAEVQATLGVAQEGKWDISRLPFDLAVEGALTCGDILRDEVDRKLN